MSEVFDGILNCNGFSVVRQLVTFLFDNVILKAKRLIIPLLACCMGAHAMGSLVFVSKGNAQLWWKPMKANNKKWNADQLAIPQLSLIYKFL